MPGLRRYGNGWSSVAGSGVSAGRTEPLPRRTGHRARVGAGHEHRQLGPRRADARRLLEDLLQRPGVAVDQPRLAVVVVHRQRAARAQVVAIGVDGFLGEEVALQAHRRLALQQRQGVGEGQQDRVPLPIGPLQEGPTVGDVSDDAGVVVWAVRVLAAEVEEVPVDLHGVDTRGTAGHGDGHVVARAGADDEHLAGVLAGDALVHGLVDGVADSRDLQPRRDAVDLGDEAARVLDGNGRHLVVRRPGRALLGRLRGEEAERGDERHHGQHDGADLARPQREEEADGGDRTPHDGVGLHEGQHGEAGDAEQAADEVELVGVEVAEAGEGAGHAVADAHHDGGDGDEHDRQHDPARRAGRVEAEEDQRLAFDADLHLQHAYEDDEDGQPERGEGEERPPAPARPQESQPDPEEAAEQHDVREVGEVQDVGAEPADQRQLDEQHQERPQDELRPQPDRLRPGASGGGGEHDRRRLDGHPLPFTDAPAGMRRLLCERRHRPPDVCAHTETGVLRELARARFCVSEDVGRPTFVLTQTAAGAG